MKTVIAPRGIPASGKTTWVREQMNSRSARINNDDIAASMFTGGRSKEHGRFLHHIRAALLRTFLTDEGIDTIYLDNTNLVVRSLNDLQMIALEHGAQFIVDDQFLLVPMEECITRDLRRGRTGGASVGEDVIRKMHQQAAKLSPWEYRDYPAVEPYEGDESLPGVWLFDMDGTLAIKHDGRGIYDISTVIDDHANEAVLAIADRLSEDSDNPVIIMSGRDESCRQQTEDWLVKHLDYLPFLFMRPEGDKRPDYVVKHELFMQHIAGKYRVLGVFDDRDQVVNLWRRRLMLPTFQVADGNF